ncbi:NAD(P)-dependent oxidoreductase [Candidatus Poribacteria bacterium]|nr:NAD(P)-dependent oxidoreductase [Candidatus Poribacteria bacterium]
MSEMRKPNVSSKKVLITGMSGLIGGVVREQLEGKYTLSALNRRPLTGVECHQADITDLDAIQPAFDGVDVVVHLAAVVRGNAAWEEVLNHNIIGTYNVFEASRRAGVKRIIYASSGATVSGWERDHPYGAIAEGRSDEAPDTWDKLTHESPIRPSGLYGGSKVWGEALARHFSDTYDISTICLRIGAVTRENRPTSPRMFSVWCSQRDIAQMVEKCVEAPDKVRFDIFFVVSDNKWSYRDVSHAREVVGFEPQDSAEAHRE